jgi:Rps23 Pro-64 3,4-dihydroxylase Tpa1-like proline 4-hydroxylase
MIPSPKLKGSNPKISHKTSLSRYKKIEIIPCTLTDNHRLRMIFTNNKKKRKPTCTWKLKNTLLNDTLVKEEIQKKFKDVITFTENEGTTYPNLWDTMKAVLRRKLIALSASKKKLEKLYISSLTAHLKALEQKEANIHKRSRWGNNQTQG